MTIHRSCLTLVGGVLLATIGVNDVPAQAAEDEIAVVVAPSVENNSRNSEGSLLDLNGGRLLLAWSDFYGPARQQDDDKPGRISAAISTDQGRRWGPRFTLQENIGKQNVMSPSLLRLKSGKILLLFLQKNSDRDCFPLVRVSTDGAKTFSPPRPIPITPSPSYTGANNDRMIQLASGRILVPMFVAAVPGSFARFVSRVYYSDDEGETWKPSETIVDVKDSSVGAEEPGVVELKDGRVMMWLRTSTGKIEAVYSSDAGVTWTGAQPLDAASPVAPASIKRIPSTGDLLMIWNNSPEHRFPLTAALSSDDGRTWRHVKNLENDPAGTYAYTSIHFVQDRVLLSYYVDRGTGPGNWSLKFRSQPVAWFYAE